MPYTFSTLVELEAAAGRILRAAMLINPQLRTDALTHILAEVRHAGQTLCDVEANPVQRADALRRLGNLFENDRPAVLMPPAYPHVTVDGQRYERRTDGVWQVSGGWSFRLDADGIDAAPEAVRRLAAG